jgi:glucosamine kinase
VGAAVPRSELFVGVDGGGTRCRARLCDSSGAVLGEGAAGPANLRLGIETSLAAVLDAVAQSLAEAGLDRRALPHVTACLALAGATEPEELAAAQRRKLPFRHTLITTDAHAACVGAHRGGEGGIVIAGTGSIGWAIVGGRTWRVGGWGLPLSDEGSGAWLGAAAMRRVLRADDGRVGWSVLLRRLFDEFDADPHAIVRWAAAAAPRDFAALAPTIVEYAAHADPEGVELMQCAARHLDAIAARLVALGAERLALMGGLAPHLDRWLSAATRRHLVAPAGDALAGALRLARTEAAALPLEA